MHKGGIKMAQTVFNRVEKKFLLSRDKYETIWEELMEHMQVDAYGAHTICNLYYDTPTDELIRNSIEKPVYKEKLRLRSYGIPDQDTDVFLEIKKKYDGIVNKRRIVLGLEEAYAYLNEHRKPDKESQILNEMNYFLSHYNLEPKVYLAYERVALFGKEDNEFRVTFDTNIRSRTNDLRLELGAEGEYILEPGNHLMEVKITNSTPLWFAKLLSKHELASSSFSKYGAFYKKQVQETMQMNEMMREAKRPEQYVKARENRVLKYITA